jgi:hypothetical protein
MSTKEAAKQTLEAMPSVLESQKSSFMLNLVEGRVQLTVFSHGTRRGKEELRFSSKEARRLGVALTNYVADLEAEGEVG